MNEIDRKLYVPRNRPTAVTPEKAEFLYSFLKGWGVEQTLEIGFAWGYSAAYIMSATKMPHIAIDPFEKNFEYYGVRNIARLGLGDNLTLIERPSQYALPRLVEDAMTVDFIFIDGSHTFDRVFVDWFFSDVLLTRGGCIVFDDTSLPAIKALNNFIRTNRQDYREISSSVRGLSVFQKKGDDNRRWKYFRDFASGENSTDEAG